MLRSVARVFFDDFRAETGDEPRDGVGRRRVGRVGEIVEIDVLFVCRLRRRRRVPRPAAWLGARRVVRTRSRAARTMNFG